MRYGYDRQAQCYYAYDACTKVELATGITARKCLLKVAENPEYNPETTIFRITSGTAVGWDRRTGRKMTEEIPPMYTEEDRMLNRACEDGWSCETNTGGRYWTHPQFTQDGDTLSDDQLIERYYDIENAD